MKKIFFVGAAILFLFTFYYYIRHPVGKKAVVNGHTIRLELAITETEKEKGLGYRDSLSGDAGMLFVYDHPDRYGFWMKGMRFPLDFIWIDGNRIVDLSQNIPVPYTLSPRVPVDKVLEVNAGVIESLGIHIGDLVQFVN